MTEPPLKEIVMRKGGPCAGPGCGATEIRGRWRYGKGEHAGKPCCVRNKCRVALGILDSAVPYPAPKVLNSAPPAALSLLVPQIPWLQVPCGTAFLSTMQQQAPPSQQEADWQERHALRAPQPLTTVVQQQLKVVPNSIQLPMSMPLAMGVQVLPSVAASGVAAIMEPGAGLASGLNAEHMSVACASAPAMAPAGSWDALLAAAQLGGSASAAGQPIGVAGQPTGVVAIPMSGQAASVHAAAQAPGAALGSPTNVLPTSSQAGGPPIGRTSPGASLTLLSPASMPSVAVPNGSATMGSLANGNEGLRPSAMKFEERLLHKLYAPGVQGVLDRTNGAINGRGAIHGHSGAIANGTHDTVQYASATSRLLEVYEIVGYQQDPPMYRISGAFASSGEVCKEACWLPADEVHAALKDSARSHGALPLMEMMKRFATRSTDDMVTRVRALGMLY